MHPICNISFPSAIEAATFDLKQAKQQGAMIEANTPTCLPGGHGSLLIQGGIFKKTYKRKELTLAPSSTQLKLGTVTASGKEKMPMRYLQNHSSKQSGLTP